MTDGWPRYDLYVITDATLIPGRTHPEIARAALEGGADAIQIRDKSSPAINLCRAVAEIQPQARKYGALLIVNDRVDVALVAGADGAHVGQQDLPAREARRRLPRPAILGVSAGSIEEAKKAARDGADYIGVGPVFSTGTKPDAGAPLGLETFSAIARAVGIPTVAIGGLNLDNVAAVIAAGAGGVAVVAAVVTADDMAAAARALKRRIVEARKSTHGT